jgi:hypothetical protein
MGQTRQDRNYMTSMLVILSETGLGHRLLIDLCGGNDCRNDADHHHHRRFQSFNRQVAAGVGAFSLSFGLFLVHQIGFVDGLFR